MRRSSTLGEGAPRGSPRRGLGLVECMISLAIAAMLLTAVAAAFKTSAEAISLNDQFFRATQAGRVSLNRILTQVRRGSVDTHSTSSNLHLITDTGQDLSYTYDSANKQLKLVTNSDTTDPDYVLARNVSQLSFGIQTGTDYAGHVCVSRVSLLITVTIGNNSVVLSGTGAPRRNLSYQ